MYIFEAGAGCTGEAKLVRPGDELIFSSSNRNEVTELENFNGQNFESHLNSTCPTAGGRPFSAPLTDAALEAMSHKQFSPETNKKIRWVTKMYRQWRAYRHQLGMEFITCDLDNSTTITQESVTHTVYHFITEVKKVDGSDFPGKTLYEIVICLQFYLETIGFPWKIVNDDKFTNVKYTLDNMMKLRTEQGIGVSVHKAEVLTATDEDLLWSLGFLGTSNPTQLLNTVVFTIGKGLAL